VEGEENDVDGTDVTGSGGQRQFRVMGKWRAEAKAAGRSHAEAQRAYDMAAQCYDACHAACETLMSAAAGEVLHRLFGVLGELTPTWRSPTW